MGTSKFPAHAHTYLSLIGFIWMVCLKMEESIMKTRERCDANIYPVQCWSAPQSVRGLIILHLS